MGFTGLACSGRLPGSGSGPDHRCRQEAGEGLGRPEPQKSGRGACLAGAVRKRERGVPSQCCHHDATVPPPRDGRAPPRLVAAAGSDFRLGKFPKFFHNLAAPECKLHFWFGSKILVKIVWFMIVKLLYFCRTHLFSLYKKNSGDVNHHTPWGSTGIPSPVQGGGSEWS